MQTYSVRFAARAPRREPFDPAVDAAMEVAVHSMRLNFQTTLGRTDGRRSQQIGEWAQALAAQFHGAPV